MKNLEDKLQQACVTWFRLQYPEVVIFAIPNGGWRNLTVAQKLKGEGVRRGVHDYCWPYKAGTYPGLFVELKSRGGQPTKEQRDFAEFVQQQGYMAVFVKGWEDAWRAVAEYAGLPVNIA